MTRILVTGGRDYGNAQRVAEVLSSIGPTTVIHGAAAGADILAGDWAAAAGVPVIPRPADWDDIDTPPVRIGVTRDGKPYNKLAGFTRNLRMLDQDQPDLIVAFPGGPGTAHCVDQAVRRGIPVMEIDR